MRKIAVIMTALLTGFSAHAVGAAETGYVAMLDQAPARGQIVAHGLLWRCADTRCVALAGNSRPAIICEALAKTAGPLASFTSGGDALPPAQLARCNGAQDAARP